MGFLPRALRLVDNADDDDDENDGHLLIIFLATALLLSRALFADTRHASPQFCVDVTIIVRRDASLEEEKKFRSR